MTAVWHASYCRAAERLYDLRLLAASAHDTETQLALLREWEEHMRTCKECEREKTE